MTMLIIDDVLKRIKLFEREAHNILGIHETSKSRIVHIEQTYKRLSGLSLKQDGLFREALCCIENELYRAAHVLAWAGFVDFLENKIAEDGFKALRTVRPKWHFKTIEELREQYPEYQIIEATRDMGLYSKSETKALHGLLNKRNECAHPGDFFPGLNETLGFISELLKRIKKVKYKII